MVPPAVVLPPIPLVEPDPLLMELVESVLMLDSVPEAPELVVAPPFVLFLLSQAPSSAVPSTIVAAKRFAFLVNIIFKSYGENHTRFGK